MLQPCISLGVEKVKVIIIVMCLGSCYNFWPFFYFLIQLWLHVALQSPSSDQQVVQQHDFTIVHIHHAHWAPANDLGTSWLCNASLAGSGLWPWRELDHAGIYVVCSGDESSASNNRVVFPGMVTWAGASGSEASLNLSISNDFSCSFSEVNLVFFCNNL